MKTLLPGDEAFHLFTDLPKTLYPAGSIRHQQKDTVSREFLHACYVLIENGAIKARAALYDNPHLLFEGKKAACVGNFESTEDPEIAAELLKYIEKEATNLGADYLIGPMNGSTWENYRFSLDHDHPNFFLEPFHHLYYNELFVTAGFVPISRYSSHIEKDLPCDYPDVLKREKELEENGMTIRGIDLLNFDSELERLYPFTAGAFSENFLYTPADRDSFKAKYTEAAKIINPEFVLIAEDKDRNIVGFIFCYDDLFNTSEKSLVMKTLARNPSEEWKGLGQILGNRIIRLMNEHGYQSQIHAFMIDSGVSTHTSRKFHGTNFKTYALYGKEL